MKYFIILLLMIGCSSPKNTENSKADFWWIIENYSPKWDKDKITTLLGQPDKIYSEAGEDNWVYRETKTNYQLWAVGITKENKVSGLAYLVERKLYIMDVEARWKNKKCEHKKETVLVAGHHYTEKRSFICDNGKIEVLYNRYNEVEGIYIK